MLQRLLLTFITIISVSACSKMNIFSKGNLPALRNPAADDEGLINDRPQSMSKFIAIMKLSAPSLLESSTINDKGERVISDEAKTALMDEQEQTIAQLKSISPEIEVVYRYKMVLNGLAIVVPVSVKDKIPNLPAVRNFQPAGQFKRPQVFANHPSTDGDEDLSKKNSVAFIEATRVHNELQAPNKDGKLTPVDGTGMKVGIIDTGIDYTHAMLGGPGTEAAYKGVKPSEKNPLFPNAKVVGGIDLVGTNFSAGSENFDNQIPKIDENPIDEAGHGTHVAGTVAGLGDGKNTYSGVAPNAKLYALKVFGADGSTSDVAVVAALDYAADPNQDMSTDDQLDVVNLSLGGSFGQPQVLYREAIKNLSEGGTVVVASAGNSGSEDFIVGSPSTADEAISVAASIDDMPHNWSFNAVRFTSEKHPSLLARAVEAQVAKPIRDANETHGKLVYIGLADKPLSDEQKNQLKGHVALIDRGGVSFLQKLQTAEAAGAIGAVVANNQPGEPIVMGGEGSVQIPAIMVTLELGTTLKEDMQNGSVEIEFRTSEKIQQPEMIDRITDFSSKGPRSQDALIKPEITAPGYNIISAAMGSGDKGVAFSGTSMSGPHVAGVMTLIKQYHSKLATKQLKSLLMSTAKTIGEKGVRYPVSRQGAGRVQTFKAETTPLLLSETALSLGHHQLNTQKVVRRRVILTNTSTEPLDLTFASESHENLKLSGPSQVHIAPGESRAVYINAHMTFPQVDQAYVELDGFVFFKKGNEEVARVPILALATRLSVIKASGLKVYSSSPTDSNGAAAEVSIKNESANQGLAFIFNLLGIDERKPFGVGPNSFRSRDCDLQAAGYRIIEKKIEGKLEKVLQVGVKLFNPMTTWHYCEVSVQIDSNNDSLADQELGGIFVSGLSGVNANVFASLLLDANKLRDIRKQYETDIAEGKNANLDYVPAVVDAQPMYAFNQSSVAIVEARLSALAIRPNGNLALKVATLYSDSDAIEADDFLTNTFTTWKTISANSTGSGFYGMPEALQLAPGQSGQLSLTKGEGREPLLVLFPQNLSTMDNGRDGQSVVLKPEFVFKN